MVVVSSRRIDETRERRLTWPNPRMILLFYLFQFLILLFGENRTAHDKRNTRENSEYPVVEHINGIPNKLT